MNITKEVTKEIINQADQATMSVEVYDFNETDDAIFCNLLDVDGNQIASRRVFTFESFPCDPLIDDEKDIIKNIESVEEIL